MNDTFAKFMYEANRPIMHLSIFIDTDDEALKELYVKAANTHNQKIIEDPDFYDSGFDLFLPDSTVFENNKTTKVDFKVKCCAQIRSKSESNYSPFYTYARSSISKTPVRLANNQGIIDAGYRGNLIGMFDCLGQSGDFWEADKNTRLLQICAPGLVPIYVNVVNSVEELGPSTRRGEGGLGSTGK